MQVRRIGDRDEQLLAALHQRQHAVLAQDLFADDADGVEVGLDGVQVQQRGAELLRGRDGDLARVGHVVLDQVGHDPHPAFLRRGNGIDHGRIGHETVDHQTLRQALEARPADRLCGNREIVHGLSLALVGYPADGRTLMQD